MGSLLGGGKGQQQTAPPPAPRDNTQDLQMMQMMMQMSGGGGVSAPPPMPQMIDPPEIQRVEVVDWKVKEAELHEKMRQAEQEAQSKKTNRLSTIVAGNTPGTENEVTTKVGVLGI